MLSRIYCEFIQGFEGSVFSCINRKRRSRQGLGRVKCILPAWKTYIRLSNFSKSSVGHLTAIGSLIQLLLGFKEQRGAAVESQRNHFIWIDKYSWTSVTAACSWKTCPAFSVKQTLPECLNCIKWWMEQIIFLTWPRQFRAAGKCKDSVPGAYCLQLVPHPALFVLAEHFLLTAVTHPKLNWWNSVRGMCRSGQASALPLICWPAFLSAKLIC